MPSSVLPQRAEARAESDQSFVGLLRDLVTTPSVSGDEARASRVFAAWARRLGFEVSFDAVGNVVCERECEAPESGGEIVLLGHIDTVVGSPPVRERGGELWGRGSVDAKGPLCAMLCAASVASLQPGTRLLVIGAVGEESHDSPGARHLATTIRPDACIIAEPSGWDAVTISYKGRLGVEVEIVRPCGHSAGQSGSASDALFDWWSRSLACVGTHNQGRERVTDRVQATIDDVSSSTDGLLDRAVMRCAFRLPIWITPGELYASLPLLPEELGRVRRRSAERAHEVSANDPVVRALRSAILDSGGRAVMKRKTGTADFNVVGPAWDCPIAAYGPGDSALDHTPWERLSLAEYQQSIGVLADALTTISQELCA